MFAPNGFCGSKRKPSFYLQTSENNYSHIQQNLIYHIVYRISRERSSEYICPSTKKKKLFDSNHLLRFHYSPCKNVTVYIGQSKQLLE